MTSMKYEPVGARGLQGRRAVYARASAPAFKTIDVYKELKKSGSLIRASEGVVIATDQATSGSIGEAVPLALNSWLPFAAPHYHISPNPEDYLMVPCIIMYSDLPNRNGVGFPINELATFVPEFGMQAYKKWTGCPVHLEHANDNITKAYGVVIDAFLRRIEGFGDGKLWKVITLLGIDRTKHPDVAEKIAKNEWNSYSMGTYVADYSCSYCGKLMGKCHHIDESRPVDFYELQGKLVYRLVHDINPFEVSIVETPAYLTAISDVILSMKDKGPTK